MSGRRKGVKLNNGTYHLICLPTKQRVLMYLSCDLFDLTGA